MNSIGVRLLISVHLLCMEKTLIRLHHLISEVDGADGEDGAEVDGVEVDGVEVAGASEKPAEITREQMMLKL